MRLQLQSFGFTKGKATQVPTYKGSPLHVLATIVRNEGVTGPFKVARSVCCCMARLAQSGHELRKVETYFAVQAERCTCHQTKPCGQR